MKSHVTVVPVDSIIVVDGFCLYFEFSAPANLYALQWHNGTGHTEWTNGDNLPLAPSDFEAEVAPFVALWEAEKARLEEEANRPPTPPTLDEVKTAKLAELATSFSAAEANGCLLSSTGFEIDATERANRDISGLVTVLSQDGAPQSTYFCDHSNTMHPVTLADLKIMQLEIIAYGQALYARKWEIRSAIEAAESVEAVQHIEINFESV